jgi:hypothetical protein
MNNFPKTLALLAEEQWKAIVNAYREGITAEVVAQESGTNVATMKQKFRAIEFKHEEGWDFEAIIVAGQGPTLSSYAKAKRNGHNEPDRVLRWRVPRRLAEAIMSSETSPDQEEALVTRLFRVAKLRTSEQFWEFLLSVFSDLSDKDIQHLAGIEPEKRKR